MGNASECDASRRTPNRFDKKFQLLRNYLTLSSELFLWASIIQKPSISS